MTQPRTNKNWLFGYTHTLKSNLLNDFRIGYHHIDFDTLNQFSVNGTDGRRHVARHPRVQRRHPVRQPGHPERQHQQLHATGAGGTNWHQFDTTFQMSDVLAWSRGRTPPRRLRPAAAEHRRRAANDARGRFNFTGDITGYSMADFMLGLPRTVIPPTDQILGHVGGWRNGIFVNDVWQATRNLTVNLGLR